MKRQQTQKLAVGLISATAALVVIPIVLVIIFIIVNGIGAINWEFLTAPPRDGMRAGGIMPALLGTVLLTFGTAIVSFPLAIGAAIYLAEYAGDNRLTRWVRLAIVNLAGIPSIVYGLFGLGAFVLFMQFGTSILAGSLTLGIMTLPVVISTAEEAILAVPQQFRGGQFEPGCHPLADNSIPGAAPCLARHYYGRYPGVEPRRRRNGPHSFHGGRVLPAGTTPINL